MSLYTALNPWVERQLPAFARRFGHCHASAGPQGDTITFTADLPEGWDRERCTVALLIPSCFPQCNPRYDEHGRIYMLIAPAEKLPPRRKSNE